MSESALSRSSKANILVVDDEPRSLRAMQDLLGGPDRNIVAAGSGREALRQILRMDFALILMDVRMPEMDGFETAALIRKLGRARHTPLIFLTAAADNAESMARGYEVGAVDYILKPVGGEALKAKVAVLVDLDSGKINLEAQIRERSTSLIAANERLRNEVAAREQMAVELKRGKQTAEAANRAKSDFLANMSHEIRTPLNAVIGLTELALQTDLTQEQREYLNLARASGESLLTILNDILDFSKVEAGRLQIETIPFSLRECGGDAMKALAPPAHSKRLELACEIARDVPDAVCGDPARLRQILLNIAGNAVKFTERGEVVVRVRRHPEDSDSRVTCHVAVRDTGIGIPKDQHRAVFASFLQADSSTTRVYGGTGLGLTIASRLVKMMDGRVWLQSEPGKGSTFHFTLSLGLQDDARIRSAAEDFGGAKVLLVEDHEASRGALAEMLESWNLEVHHAGDSAAAESRASAANRHDHEGPVTSGRRGADSSRPDVEQRELPHHRHGRRMPLVAPVVRRHPVVVAAERPGDPDLRTLVALPADHERRPSGPVEDPHPLVDRPRQRDEPVHLQQIVVRQPGPVAERRGPGRALRGGPRHHLLRPAHPLGGGRRAPPSGASRALPSGTTCSPSGTSARSER